MDKHLDMTELTRTISESREQDLQHSAICLGDADALRKLGQEGSLTFNSQKCHYENEINRRGTLLGERQVESLLRFMVSREVQYQMEDVAADELIYDNLGEHRILGKKKKKKKRMVSY